MRFFRKIFHANLIPFSSLVGTQIGLPIRTSIEEDVCDKSNGEFRLRNTRFVIRARFCGAVLYAVPKFHKFPKLLRIAFDNQNIFIRRSTTYSKPQIRRHTAPNSNRNGKRVGRLGSDPATCTTHISGDIQNCHFDLQLVVVFFFSFATPPSHSASP